MHPADMDDTGLDPGASVDLTSGHGTVRAFVQPDPTLRRGVVSMTHCFGGEPGSEDDPRQYGTNPARLLSISAGLQPISLMPHMTAVPVRVSPADRGGR
jgi:anaerobic selenocysteine-containing dehydrogenase